MDGGTAGDGLVTGGVGDVVRVGVSSGRPLFGLSGDGLGEGLVEVGVAEGVAEGEADRGAVERRGGVVVGAEEDPTAGVGSAAGSTAGGGCHRRVVGSTNGMMVSGRTGPPAKLTPTRAVYATPASPRA
ncbi:GTPase [Micromonospora sp. NPDC050187]|uniref:GTPase n=1 Tax=Micromonospora sp. NPDC050187 TaxID=3364277 RepID=UPI003789FFDB